MFRKTDSPVHQAVELFGILERSSSGFGRRMKLPKIILRRRSIGLDRPDRRAGSAPGLESFFKLGAPASRSINRTGSGKGKPPGAFTLTSFPLSACGFFRPQRSCVARGPPISKSRFQCKYTLSEVSVVGSQI